MRPIMANSYFHILRGYLLASSIRAILRPNHRLDQKLLLTPVVVGLCDPAVGITTEKNGDQPVD
jgi:hypothetical protein